MNKRIKKTADSAEKLLNEAMKDPLVQDYFKRQKMLFKATLDKAIKKAKKRIDEA